MVEPCNLCGFTPVECNDSGIEVVPCKCFMPDDWTVYRERWNALQQRILAQRRKDFEAGFLTGANSAAKAVAEFFGRPVGDFEPGPGTPEFLRNESNRYLAKERGEDGK